MKRFTKQVQLFIARGGLVIMLALAAVLATSAVGVRADGEDEKGKATVNQSDVNDLFEKPEDDKDVLKDVNSLAQNATKSAIAIVRTVGVAIALGGLLVVGLKLGTGDPTKRAKAKEEFGWKIAALVIFVGGAAIFGFAIKIANALAGAL